MDLQVAAPSERSVSPYRGLNYSAEGIREVRDVARNTERGRLLAEEIFEAVKPWLALADEDIRDLVPGVDAIFARGVAGDPKTGRSWPPSGRGSGMCSLERPGTVRSPHTGDIYGDAAPGERYYDDGTGWVRPSDGRRFYFRGIWNSWIVGQLHTAVDNLALAYMLTGDEAIAARGLLILDELASLSARRGEDPGLEDGSAYGATNKHFLSFSGNGANSRVFQTALALDLLAGSEKAFQLSVGIPDKSIFENLRDNYFDIYELFYKEQRHTLYNHTTGLFANQLAQAVLFGWPEELAEGLEVIGVWLDKAITRDGQYYENAGGYERVGVDYAAMMMLPVENYSPHNYDDSEAFPDPQDYPFGLRFGNDPRWYSAAYLMKYRMMASGRMIAYGDMWEDRLIIPGRTRDWDPRFWCAFGRLLYIQTDNPEWKEEISRRYWSLPDDIRNEPNLTIVHRMGMSQWLEPSKPETPVAPRESLLQESSDFLPGKMIALMRSGENVNHRTAFISGSVHYMHGHDNQMHLLLYAKGMSLNGNYGYPGAGSPAHRGWAIKPSSHWTLVVNEDLPAPNYPAKNAPPASLQGWVTAKDGISVQLVEMSNPHLWRDRIEPEMSEYRRLHWMVDVSDEDFYFLDFFRATGGRSHDYFWTGQWLDQARPSEGFAVQGVNPQRIPGVWSMAGLSGRYRDADFNVPGRSWGERLERNSSGRIGSLGIPGERINVDRHWNPPPGNGYGFIYDVRGAEVSGNWSATWDLIDRRNMMRLTFVNDEPQTAITARNPAFEEARYHKMVVARRMGESPLRSRFAALVEAAPANRWPVVEAERLDLSASGGMGVRLSLNNGSTDVLLAGDDANSEIDTGDIRLKGARGFVRTNSEGAVSEMLLHEGHLLEAGLHGLAFDSPNWEATVIEVIHGDFENQVVVDAPLPAGNRLTGRPVIFSGSKDRSGPSYLQDESYMLRNVEPSQHGSRLEFGEQRIVSSSLVVDAIEDDGAIISRWPNEIRGGRFADTGLFAGRRVVVSGDADRFSHVESYPNRKKFYPAEKGVFKKGDRLEFRTIQQGDRARMPRSATLKRVSDREWELTANGDVFVRLPAGEGDVLYAGGSDSETMERVAVSNGKHVQSLVSIALTSDGRTLLRLASSSALSQEILENR